MSRRNIKIEGDIQSIRDVEDVIRATHQYTKGLFRKAVRHPLQGEDFPSRLLSEYYEVYPYVKLSWDMPANLAWAWVWGDERHINVRFIYDYRANKAEVIITEGEKALVDLKKGIPGFSAALAHIKRPRPVVESVTTLTSDAVLQEGERKLGEVIIE